MDPQIRYVKTADGATLATATLGSGPPLVLLPGSWAGTIEVWWAIPEARAWLERLAGRFTVVLYDARGQGLSDRDAEDFSLDGRVADIEAVFAGLALPGAFLVGGILMCPAAISFAARHPDLVRRLALLQATARGRDWHLTPRSRAIQHLFALDYDLYWKCQALISHDWTEIGRLYGSLAPKAISADVMTRTFTQFRQHDAADALKSVHCPALVVGSRADETPVPLEVTRRVAAALPGARFRVSDSPMGFGDWRLAFAEADAAAVVGFFDEDCKSSA